MKHEVAVVEWVDACIAPTSSYYSKDDDDIHLMTIVSVGLVVKETEELIALAIDCQSDLAYPYRHLNMIPKSGIKRIQRFEVTTGEPNAETAQPYPLSMGPFLTPIGSNGASHA